MSRAQKFWRLLQFSERCSESLVYHDGIVGAVERIQRFHPYLTFDHRIHVVDFVTRQYLEKTLVDARHLVPVDVDADGNCLYYSVLVLMNNSMLTAAEITGVLGCSIRSVYPDIDFRHNMAVMNNTFTPAPPVVANYEITILWSNVLNEMSVRACNNNVWNPNHFVSLMSSNEHHESGYSNRVALIVKTPEKKTFKNNAIAQVSLKTKKVLYEVIFATKSKPF
ncbi:hypothetical protein I4U23_005747 [Adineta vaga]|nr:hypothetical protein I4U23_005747 [Adineta vaga]